MAVALLAAPALGFFDQIFEQLNAQQGGGGGGGHTFQFNMGGGGGRPVQARWPKGVSKKITKKYTWLKATTWEWNGNQVKFEADGSFKAQSRECQMGACKWSANKGRVHVIWGGAGHHKLKVEGLPKAESETAQPMPQAGVTKLVGKRMKDGAGVTASFISKDEDSLDLDVDFYAVLGVDDDATDRQIKKAYRRLSLKYHPDKNPDDPVGSKRKFDEVRRAYEVLSDPDKKILFDTGGIEAVQEAAKEDAQGGGQQHHPLFGMMGGGGGEKRKAKKGPDANVELAVSLEDMYKGGEVAARIQRRIVCRGCKGRSDGKCAECGRCPDEVKMVNRQMGHMVVQQQQRVKSEWRCKNADTELNAVIEQGMAAGSQITFPRMSEQTPGMIPGDIVMSLKQKKHARFERTGNDLRTSLRISLKEALLGFERTIPHLDDHTVVLSRDSPTVPSTVHRITGEGMPLHNTPSEKGDMFVKLEVDFPATLSAAQKEAVAEIFAE